MADDKKNEPMDKTMPEGEAVMYVNRPRNTYAMDQLIKEVTNLFPETEYEVSHRNQRNVAFDVQFALMPGGYMGLRDLLHLIEDDIRVVDIVADAEGVLVSFRNNPVIMDDPTPFNLEAAWEVMDEGQSYDGGSL
jgi:hypothetical protein